MLYIGGALFVAFLPSGVVIILLNIEERLLRKAVAFRKASSQGGQVKGFTSRAYEAVKKNQNPWEL